MQSCISAKVTYIFQQEDRWNIFLYSYFYADRMRPVLATGTKNALSNNLYRYRSADRYGFIGGYLKRCFGSPICRKLAARPSRFSYSWKAQLSAIRWFKRFASAGRASQRTLWSRTNRPAFWPRQIRPSWRSTGLDGWIWWFCLNLVLYSRHDSCRAQKSFFHYPCAWR